MDRRKRVNSCTILRNPDVERKDSGQPRQIIPNRSATKEELSNITAANTRIASGTLERTDILRDEQECNRHKLLKWNAALVQSSDQSILNAQPSRFLGIWREWLQLVSLPSRVFPCGQADELHAEIASKIRSHIATSDYQVDMLAAFVMASWFPDIGPTAAYLWIVGPLGSGKTSLLRILQCMCRRAILVGDITPASLYSMCTSLEPTLLIDESEYDNSVTSAKFRGLLRSGSVRGVSTVRNGRPYSTFGFKVIACRQLPTDAALTSRGIHVFMSPMQRDVEPLDYEAIRRITDEYQGKLLRFRMENYSRVLATRLPSELVGHLTPRTRDLARTLLAPIFCEPRIVQEVLWNLEEFDQNARADQMLEPEWLVMTELYRLVHQENLTEITVGLVTAAVNANPESRGENFPLNPRKVGSIMKTLGIRTRKLNSLGRGFQFNKFLRRQIHRMAVIYGIHRSDIALNTAAQLESREVVPCRFCDEFKLSGNSRLVPVQEVRPLQAQLPDLLARQHARRSTRSSLAPISRSSSKRGT